MALRYPSDGFSGDADYVSFKPIKYSSRSGYSGGGGGGYIILYMPEQQPLVSNGNMWNQMTFHNPLTGAAGGLAGQAVQEGFEGLNNFVLDNDMTAPIGEERKSRAIDDFKDYAANLGSSAQPITKQTALQAIAGAMGYTPNQVMSVTTGKIYNPNIELAYQGPGLREFSFSFNLVAKSQGESQAINNIIREFKKWSAPAEASGGMYEIPYVWQINYMSGGGSNSNLNKFKPAACMAVTVQDNSSLPFYSAHQGGAPIQTSLTLSFKEIDVILRKDHSGGRGM
jgi:hypothetical protein